MPATIPLLQEGRYSIEQEFPYVEDCLLFQAYDTQKETPVTIVEVPIQLSRVSTAAQREAVTAAFAEQAKTLTGFSHKSVVAVRGYFTEAGRNYVVTDRVDGVDLAAVLADQKQPFTVGQIAGWADTVLDVLNAMHNSRPALVYRNLRPENIMLRSDGNVDLVASGMICRGDRGNGSGSPLAYSPLEQIWSGLDAASQKVIISKYDETSERILKQDLDAKCDLYALGATLYHLATGQVPVDALERSIEMIDGNADPLNSPNKLCSSIPVEVSDVIMKAMEIKREYRFDSAAIMRQVLRTALVRVKEREAEESLVRKVEQTDVRPAVQNGASPAAPEPKASHEDAVQKRREAEENRFETERRAADAEKKLRETEVVQSERISESFNLAELEDDVLGLLSPSTHISEPPQAKATIAAAPVATEQRVENTTEIPAEAAAAEPEAPAVEETEQGLPARIESTGAALEIEPEDAGTSGVGMQAKPDSAEEPRTEPVEQLGAPAPVRAAAAAASFSVSSDREMFSEGRSGSRIGIPAVAAAAVVLCIAAVGGWFYFGSKPAPAATAEAPAATQPAQPPQQETPAASAFQSNDTNTTAGTASVPAGEQPVTDLPADDQPNGSDQQPQKVAAVTAPKAKKPAQAPAKTPAQKKPVTVDDLINDN